MKIIEKELNLVKKYILEGFNDPMPSNALSNFITLGSKFVRSAIAILFIKSHNLEINEQVLKILAVGEIIHSASLLHDDVLDDAEIRRGTSTIAKEYTPKISILAGDYLLSRATEILLELNDIKMLSDFKLCTQKMTEAEFKQFFLRGAIPVEKEYIDICKKKTACLFDTILKACVNKMGINGVNNFGELFGICFQIKNDLNNESAKQDSLNGIYTAKDILGIEKTIILLDNYKKEMRAILSELPDNIYKKRLEGLVEDL